MAASDRVVVRRAIFPHEEETRLVCAYLAGPPGVFVEVGAFEPVTRSQTYALEQAGWIGLLIEPHPEQAARLRAERRARVIEVACGPPELHDSLQPMRMCGGLSTLRQSKLPQFMLQTESRPVRLRTLDAVLQDAAIQRLDFLSIDVEGYELEVLRGFSIERWRPRLVLIEDFAESTALHRQLTRAGYKRVRRTGDNSWYVPRDTPFPISWFGGWQLLRKYYLAHPIRLVRVRIRDLARRIGLRRH
jgi:FkbM family methyltransferase